MQKHVIVYIYKRKKYYCVTKPCTLAQAQAAFDEDLNSLNTFKLVTIYAAGPDNLAALQRMQARGENVSIA